MLDRLYNSVSMWLPLIVLIVVPSLIAAALWRMWSKSTEFELTNKEKFLRIAIVVGAAVFAALLMSLFVKPSAFHAESF